MADDERDTSRALAEDSVTPLRADEPERAKPPKSPPPNPFHTAAALTSLEARLKESETRRLDYEERVRRLEKLVDGLIKNFAEPAAARAGSTEPAVARVGEFSLVRSVPLYVPPHTFLGRSSNTADPLARTLGGESNSEIRDGPSSAVISSHWRGTLPDREGLWTGAHPERLVSFTAFGESYLSLLCDISTSDLFDTSRVIQLVATLFSSTTTRQRRQSPRDWAVDELTDAVREGRPHCWTSLMTAVGRRWPDPGFADRVAEEFYGCRQASSRAYDHVGEWRARYRAFVHNNSSFTLSALQLATAFYQSLSDAAKREVRAGMLREYRDNSLVTTGRFGQTVPSIDDITDWAAIADEIASPTADPTPSTRTARHPDPVGRVKDVASSSCKVETSSSSSQPTAPVNEADRHRLDDSLADSALDAVEDVSSYADAESRLRRYWGPEVVSSRKAERTASVSSFQVPVPSGASLLASAVLRVDIDEPDRPVEPAIVRARNIIAWTLPSGRVLRCLIDSGSEVDLVDHEVVRADSSFATARLTAPLHLRLGTQNKSDRCAVFATAPFSSGALDLGSRAFFICRVTGYDAILGLPFLKDTGMLVGWGAFPVAHPGPSQPLAKGTYEWDRAVTVAPIFAGSAIGYCGTPDRAQQWQTQLPCPVYEPIDCRAPPR